MAGPGSQGTAKIYKMAAKMHNAETFAVGHKEIECKPNLKKLSEYHPIEKRFLGGLRRGWKKTISAEDTGIV